MSIDRKALLIGIENYNVFPKVDYANFDAEIINEALKEYQCLFSTKILLDHEATTNEILRHFRKIIIDSDDDAVIIFFFSGHGVTIDNATFLVTINDENDDISPGVHITRLIEIVNANRKSNQSFIFILDCCHAGALPIEDCVLNMAFLETNIIKTTGTYLIAASTNNTNAYPNDKVRQGVFTNWLFHGLTGSAADKDGKITVNTLYDFISKAMAEHNQQTPTYKVSSYGVSPILGEDFLPQEQIEVSTLTELKWLEIESTTKEVLKELRKNTETDAKSWLNIVYKETSNKLSDLINWRIALERSHPELKKKQEFRFFDPDILQIQIKLSNLQTGTNTIEGKVIDKIGSGGFGNVYKIQGNNEILAYKVYHSNQLNEYEKLKSFKRGYKAMKTLNHQNIVHVKNSTNAPEGFFMQYIDGPNFRNWWSEDLVTMLNILHILAQTLEYAHNQKVVHRDIKPENIIIDENNPEIPIPYLTDFDLAWYSTGTVYSTLENPVSAFGHYLYAAPEQYDKPDSDITRKATTDVYGFGQLCYFAICNGDPERDNSSSIAILRKRLANWPNEKAASTFLSLYEKCTKRNPSERYQTMIDVSASLLEIRKILIDPYQSKDISSERFLSELFFSLFGYEFEPNKIFNSRSGRTTINIQKISKYSIEIKFDIIQGYSPVNGSFDQQRNTLNRRVDDVLAEAVDDYPQYRFKRQRVDIADTYCTRIDINGSICSFDGVLISRHVIQKIINCLE